MQHIISLSLALALFWILNSGHTGLLMLSLAGGSIAFVVYIAHKMDVVDHESTPVHLTFRLPGYYFWLTKEVIASNLTVLKHIWLGNKSISPAMARIDISQTTDLAKVIYANSITLTPGTVSVNIEGNQILVHALLEQSIEDLKQGEMDRRVTRLEN
jgi:multicomponent Na+:H+ antiporter subunit E